MRPDFPIYLVVGILFVMALAVLLPAAVDAIGAVTKLLISAGPMFALAVIGGAALFWFFLGVGKRGG